MLRLDGLQAECRSMLSDTGVFMEDHAVFLQEDDDADDAHRKKALIAIQSPESYAIHDTTIAPTLCC